MTKPKKKGRWLATAYWSLVGAGSALLLSLQPVFADTIWTRFSTIMKDVYGQLVTISTIVLVPEPGAEIGGYGRRKQDQVYPGHRGGFRGRQSVCGV